MEGEESGSSISRPAWLLGSVRSEKEKSKEIITRRCEQAGLTSDFEGTDSAVELHDGFNGGHRKRRIGERLKDIQEHEGNRGSNMTRFSP